jgi:gp6-like head-tail connector protein
MPSLVSLSELKAFLGITSSEQDAQLTVILDGVSVGVESLCQRTFALGTYTEVYDILTPTQDLLFPENFPIQTIVALTSGTTPLDASEFAIIDQKMLVRKLPQGTYFTPGYQQVSLMYAAGYYTIPADLKLVVMRACDMVNKSSDIGNFTSERIGDYSYSILGLAASKILADPFLNGLLQTYRRVSM